MQPKPSRQGPGLSDFIGRWRVERRVEDRLAGGILEFAGEAVFAPDAGGLLYSEQGELCLADGQRVQAGQAYRWREEGGLIAVDFEDGRAFHSFDPAARQIQAQHWCDPDDYAVRYDLSDWPDWQTRWRVRGPRKDYVMTSRYSRAGS